MEIIIWTYTEVAFPHLPVGSESHCKGTLDFCPIMSVA